MGPLVILAVGLGGALGALCRSKATTALKLRLEGPFPWPTLLINLTSCFLAGLLLYAQAAFNQTAYLALTMGFLSGFSTLSTMNYEAVDLVLSGKARIGAAYLAITYASTLGAAALGFTLARALG